MGIKIVLADDHKIVRDGLRSLLERHNGMEVVAEAPDGRTALQIARNLTPDIIIMDISMPGLNGIEASRQIKNELPKVKLIALSVHADKRFITEMLKAGASAYLLKDCAFEELFMSIQAVMANNIYLSPKISATIVDDYIQMKDITFNGQPFNSPLSSREREVLQLLVEGKDVKEIATILNLSARTIETHRRNIMLKLDIYNLPELTKYAIREGLTPL